MLYNTAYPILFLVQHIDFLAIGAAVVLTTLLLIGYRRAITYAKATETKVLTYQRQFEQVHAFNDMIGNILHDFKTPLCSIRMSLAIIEQATTAQHQLELDAIDKQTTHLERLVQDILTIVRLSQVPDFDPKPIAVNKMVKKTVDAMRLYAMNKHISMTLQLSSEIVQVLGDDMELERAIGIIVLNAINHTPEYGTVIIRSYATTHHTIIEVRDTGGGISTENLPDIFKRYFHVSTTEQTCSGGTALGLAISQQIFKKHQGMIEVESHLGMGSTFRIILPLVKTQAC